MKIYFLLFALLNVAVLSIRPLIAQTAPSVAWDRTFGGTSQDELTCIEQTDDGGYIVGGWSTSDSTGDKTQPTKGLQDYWIVKLDSIGNKLWDRSFGGSGSDYLHSIKQTSDGGYILAGYSDSGMNGDKGQPSKGRDDFWIIKLDRNGNKVWDKGYGNTQYELLFSIQQTRDGGYILGGASSSGVGNDKSEPNRGTYPNRDFWVLKVDGTGNKLWDKTIGGRMDDVLFAMEQTADGGYILGGGSMSGIGGDKTQPNKGGGDYWVVKLDSNGGKIWDTTMGGGGADHLYALRQTRDGGFILGGFSDSNISGDKSENCRGSYDYWIVKLNNSGNKVWDKTLGGSGTEYLRANTIYPTADGGFILGGSSDSGGSGDKTDPSKGGDDFWIVRIDSLGNKLWDKTIGGNGGDFAISLQETKDGGYILGGITSSGISGDKTQAAKGHFDFWVVKLNAPCSNLTASLSIVCNKSDTAAKINIPGIQTMALTTGWTLTFTKDGIIQTVSGTTSEYILAENLFPGTVISLVSLVSGTCTTLLNQTITIESIPEGPVVFANKRCGPGPITFSAKGAPSGGRYFWYDSKTGGTSLFSDSSGTFISPNLNAGTTFYVAAANINGCEGPRTAVSGFLNDCPPPFIPNIITQNNDGLNDTFKPQYLPGSKWHLQIFNRWGTRIFEAEDYRNNWPDRKITDGVYYYLLRDPESGQQFKGWLEVVK